MRQQIAEGPEHHVGRLPVNFPAHLSSQDASAAGIADGKVHLAADAAVEMEFEMLPPPAGLGEWSQVPDFRPVSGEGLANMMRGAGPAAQVAGGAPGHIGDPQGRWRDTGHRGARS
jgi:hypothetical protein